MSTDGLWRADALLGGRQVVGRKAGTYFPGAGTSPLIFDNSIAGQRELFG